MRNNEEVKCQTAVPFRSFCSFLFLHWWLRDDLLLRAPSFSLSPPSHSLVFLIFDGTSLSDPSAVCDRRLFFSDSLLGVLWAPVASGSKSFFCSAASASIACSLTSSAGTCAVAPSFLFFFFRFFFSSSSPAAHGCKEARINTLCSAILYFNIATAPNKITYPRCWIVSRERNWLPVQRLGENPWFPGSIFRRIVQHLFERSNSSMIFCSSQNQTPR